MFKESIFRSILSFFLSVFFIFACFQTSSLTYAKNQIHHTKNIHKIFYKNQFNRALSLTTISSDETVGSIEGKLQVTPTGNAAYTLPIDAPPGTAGMTPKISIGYNSQRKDGLLGMGFSIEGLTTIDRSSSNMAQNGVTRGVHFNQDDRFTLDGEQLVAINGTYGADQTEYHTYFSSASKIISYGQQGNGPAKFKVWTKGGQIAEYGFSSDSQIDAQGKNTIAMWALNKIEDTTGNYIHVTYSQDKNLGTFYPSEIDYTGNDQAKVSPYNSIQFIYIDRPDITTHYHEGSKTTLNKLLSEIKVLHGSTVVYDYKFTYDQSPSTGRSRLVSIQKCNGNNICLPATKFGWQNKKDGWTKSDITIPTDLTVFDQNGRPQHVAKFIDLTEDGLPDIVKSAETMDKKYEDERTWLNYDAVWHGPTLNYDLPKPMMYYDNGSTKQTGFFADLTGDELQDYIYLDETANPREEKIWLNTGESWQPASFSFPELSSELAKYQTPYISNRLIDLNGDGRSDYVLSFSDVINSAWINNDNGWDENDAYKLPEPMLWGDVNNPEIRGYFASVSGDGLPDYIYTYYDSASDYAADVYLNTGNGWQKANYSFPLPPDGKTYKDTDKNLSARLVDLNGDGLTDYVYSFKNNSGDETEATWINTGEGWITDNNYKLPRPMFYIDGDKVQQRGYFVDVNGDGKPDYLYLYYNSDSDHAEEVWLNTGNGWKKADYAVPIDPTVHDSSSFNYADRFVDVTGEGLPDYVYSYSNRGQHTITQAIYLNNGPVPDLLSTITDGLGETTSITYSSLTNSAVFTKENNGKYPNVDIQIPSYVVAQTSSSTVSNDPKTQNKNGGQHITKYHYKGAKFNSLGLGFLGFEQVTTTDQSTGINVTTTYSQNTQDHTFEKPLSIDTYLADGKTLISSTQNTWDVKVFGDGSANHTYYFPYTSQVIKKSFTQEGKLISSTTVKSTIDDYGNPTKIINNAQDNSGTYTTTTENSYNNDTSNWHLGAITKATVTAEAPNFPTITRTSSFEYDPTTGMLSKTIVEPEDEDNALTTTYKRDPFGNIIETTITGKNINSRTDTVQYDANGQFVISETNTLGQTIYQTNDPKFGEITQSKDLNGLTTNYQYDDFGRLIEVDNPDGTKETTAYQWCHQNNTPTDAVYSVSTNEIRHQGEGPLTTKYYDKLNRQVAESKQGFDGKLIWTKSTYDDLGRVVTQSLPFYEGQKEYNGTLEYDTLGRVIRTVKPDGSVIRIQYNGLSTTTINPLDQASTKIANVRGNVIESIDNLGNYTDYDYDAFGNLITVHDSKGNISTITYDKYGKRKIAINDPDKGKWEYTYDVLGELKSETDSLGHTTTIDYDDLGRMIQRTDPAGTSTWEYGMDPAKHDVGQLVHVSGVANASGGKANGNDLIRAAQDNLVSYDRSYTYNDLALPAMMTTELNGEKYSKVIQYDADSRPSIEINSLDDIQVENVYNDLGYLSQIKNSKTDHIFYQVNAMDASGQVISESHGNNLITTRTYDPETGFLTDIETKPNEGLKLQRQMFPGIRHNGKELKLHRHPENAFQFRRHPGNRAAIIRDPATQKTNALNQSLHYTYDALGNLKKRVDDVNNRTETFDYDQLNRLTTWNDNQNGSTHKLNASSPQLSVASSPRRRGSSNGTPTIHTYTYDALGNMTSNSNVGKYHYGDVAGPHAVTSITDGPLPSSFKYDLNGNQTEGTINGVTRNISYTSYDKPKQITQGNTQVDFYYNADRSRFERMDQVDGKTTTTLYLGDLEKITYQDGDTVTTEIKHYIGPNTLYDTEPDGHAYEYEMLKDNLGSVVEITNDEGANIQGFHYAPFGLQTQISGLTPKHPYTHSGFTGQEEVEAVNLIHMNGRLYDPVIGRFLSADPFIQDPENSQSLNRYSYCINNPLAYTDPTGYWFLEDLFEGFFDCLSDLLSNEYVSQIVGIAISAIAYANPLFAPATPWLFTAMVSSGYNGVLTSLAGGDIDDVMKNVGISFATSCVWKGVGSGLEGVPGLGEADPDSWFGRSAVHGFVGGGLEAIQGGNFADGFIAAASAETIGQKIDPLVNNQDLAIRVGSRVGAAALVGGTAAAMNGGDFINGAQTAAYTELFGSAVTETYTAISQSTEDYFQNQYSSKEELVAATGTDAIVFGIRPLEPLGDIEGDVPSFARQDRGLYHENVFIVDSNGNLTNYDYSPNGINPDKNFTNNQNSNISKYRFSVAYKLSPAQTTKQAIYRATHPKGFSGSNYSLFTHNCQVYSDAVRRNFGLPSWHG